MCGVTQQDVPETIMLCDVSLEHALVAIMIAILRSSSVVRLIDSAKVDHQCCQRWYHVRYMWNVGSHNPPPLRARTDARRTNPSAQRSNQLRSVLASVYDVSIHNQITNNVP
jgi:hypothetical protein